MDKIALTKDPIFNFWVIRKFKRTLESRRISGNLTLLCTLHKTLHALQFCSFVLWPRHTLKRHYVVKVQMGVVFVRIFRNTTFFAICIHPFLKNVHFFLISAFEPVLLAKGATFAKSGVIVITTFVLLISTLLQWSFY